MLAGHRQLAVPAALTLRFFALRQGGVFSRAPQPWWCDLVHTRLVSLIVTTLVGLMAALGSVVTTASPAAGRRAVVRRARRLLLLGGRHPRATSTTAPPASARTTPTRRLLADQKGYALNFKACSGATIPTSPTTSSRALSAGTSVRDASRSAATTPGSPTCSPSARSRTGPSDCDAAVDAAQAYINNTLPGRAVDAVRRHPQQARRTPGWSWSATRGCSWARTATPPPGSRPAEETRLNQTADLLNGKLAAAAAAPRLRLRQPDQPLHRPRGVRQTPSGSTGSRTRSARATTPTRPGHASGYAAAGGPAAV